MSSARRSRSAAVRLTLARMGYREDRKHLQAFIRSLDDLAKNLMLAAAEAQLAQEQAWTALAELERQHAQGWTSDHADQPEPEEPRG